MPYRTPGGSRYSGTSMRTLRRTNSTLNRQSDYGYEQSGTLRHEFLAQHDSEFTTSVLAAGDYQQIDMLRFKRTFTVSPDEPDTPTAGNNYQTPEVFNGSLIRDYSRVLKITSREATNNDTVKSFTLDIYQLVYSFFDAHTYEAFSLTAGLGNVVEFDNSGNDAGEVNFVSTHPTFTSNTVKNSKFLQRYIQLIGRVEIPVGQTVKLNINRIPPKVRRANSGMFWGLIIHNDSITNDANGFGGAISTETSFKELPSDNRLPFLY